MGPTKKIKTNTTKLTTEKTNQLIYSMINNENTNNEWQNDYTPTTITNFNALFEFGNLSTIHSKIHKQNLSKSNWANKLLKECKTRTKQQVYLYSISLNVIDFKKFTSDKNVKNNDSDDDKNGIIKPCGFGGI